MKSPELEEVANAMDEWLLMAEAWNKAVESDDPTPYQFARDLEESAAGRALHQEDTLAMVRKWYNERSGGAMDALHRLSVHRLH